jgi:hypothetical protein
MKTMILAISGLLLLGSAAMADSGPLRDPTGCATGSAVANCRSLPPMSRGSSGSDLRDHNRERDRSGSKTRFKTSPLPSEQLLPPSSTGLDKGSTGINKHPLGGKSRMGH